MGISGFLSPTTASRITPHASSVNQASRLIDPQGRGHYEEEVIVNPEAEASTGPHQQLYNDRGYPRNPETKRQEREHVRAANEVMQVTGVVEDSLAAKVKASKYVAEKNQETLTGLRFMEAGRAVLVGGVWGVLGLRRRILVSQLSACHDEASSSVAIQTVFRDRNSWYPATRSFGLLSSPYFSCRPANRFCISRVRLGGLLDRDCY